MGSPDPRLDDAAVAVQIAGKYTSALRRAPMAVVEHGDDLRVTAWNEGATRLLGYTSEEALGRSVERLLRLGSEEEKAWRQAARAGGDAGWVCACVHKDGREVQCEWLFSPLFDERGDPAGAIGFGRDVTTRFEAEAKQRKDMKLFRVILDNLPVVLFAVDSKGICTFHDGKGLEQIKLSPGQLVGADLLKGYEHIPGLMQLERAMTGEKIHGDPTEANGLWWETWIVPTGTEDGVSHSAAGIMLDVTQTKLAEREILAKLDLIERQQLVIRELSTPIIEVWDKVLTLPMVGVVDSARTAEVMDSLLDAVVHTGARFAILDLTGVEAVDSKTAAYLIELVRAVRLLGAEGIITGIRPTVAQTVVALGLDLTSITTLSNLRAGLKHCIMQRNKERITGKAAGQPADPAR